MLRKKFKTLGCKPSEYFVQMYNSGRLEFSENICMECFKECTDTELVHTGDDESFEGYEVRSWCNDCQVETFHKIREINTI